MRMLGRRTTGIGAAALVATALAAGTAVTAPANGATGQAFTRPAAGNGDIARAALRAVATHRSAVHASDAQDFTATGVLVDPDGTRHTRITRTYHGLRVLGGDLVVHQTRTGAWEGGARR